MFTWQSVLESQPLVAGSTVREVRLKLRYVGTQPLQARLKPGKFDKLAVKRVQLTDVRVVLQVLYLPQEASVMLISVDVNLTLPGLCPG